MNCKQGDLAFIVRAHNAENIGRLVEVVRPYQLGERLPSVDGKRTGRITTRRSSNSQLWVIRSHGSPLLWSNPHRSALYWERAFNDDYLRPIPKLDEPEQTTTEEPTGELA